MNAAIVDAKVLDDLGLSGSSPTSQRSKLSKK